MREPTFYQIRPNHPEWSILAEIISNISWSAGKSLSRKMLNHEFNDWECLLIGKNDEQLSCFCTLTKQDSLKKDRFSPFTGYVFVFEEYRGQRLSQKLLLFGEEQLNFFGFSRVYLVSDEKGLYEKYGYQSLSEENTTSGEMETLFFKDI